MVLGRVAAFFGAYGPSTSPSNATVAPDKARQGNAGVGQDGRGVSTSIDLDEEEGRPPYAHAMIAGGLGGTMGDMLMHGLDTVKTRQQGDPHIPSKYTSMLSTSQTIYRQEGFVRGLYSGVTPAFVGSSFGAVIFFGTYEWTKRQFIDAGLAPSLSYLSAGFLADLASSPLYVPSEVVKTRLQLQGRYNNPYFNSGYNYRSSLHALTTIVRKEGVSELFSGYKATLLRDLPYSAMQFAFYEKEQAWARRYTGSKDIGLGLEVLTGASAGALAGIITCPLDVVKTRIQTSLDPIHLHPTPILPASLSSVAPATAHGLPSSTPSSRLTSTKPSSLSSDPSSADSHSRSQPRSHPHPHTQPASSTTNPSPSSSSSPPSSKLLPSQKRQLSTSSPSTSLRPPTGATPLDTESVLAGLKAIYRSEGLKGWFRGVAPRAVWTSIQSGTMLVVYQNVLKWFENHYGVETF